MYRTGGEEQKVRSCLTSLRRYSIVHLENEYGPSAEGQELTRVDEVVERAKWYVDPQRFLRDPSRIYGCSFWRQWMKVQLDPSPQSELADLMLARRQAC